jgi:hypothetical protein
MDLQGQIGKMVRDITSAPPIFDLVSIAIAGGAVGGFIGYLKDRNAKGAKSFALWGAGLGVAGEYMLFHVLKPALRRTGSGPIALMPRFGAYGEFVGDGAYRPPEKCPDGFHWETSSTSDRAISGVRICAPDPAPAIPPKTGPITGPITGWGHGEMMGAVPYPYYYARHEMPGLAWWE